MKKIITLFFISLLLTGCLKEEHPFTTFDGIQPAAINDGWEISSPAAQDIDEAGLSAVFENIHNQGEPWQLRSLLIIRNGKLVAETYFKDANDLHQPRPVWSCTKQILGILAGIAVSRGHLNSIDDPISDYLPDELTNHPDKRDITIANLLTMRSGFDFDEQKDVSTIWQRSPDNTIDFILGLPMIYPSGETFNYNSGDPHLIAASIQNAVDKPLEDWADEVLFSKMGFDNYTWLKYDGYNFGGYGISTTPRQLAKMAQLVLNKGNWQGTQLIDSLWIEEMVKTQTVTQAESDYTFGYLWWISESEGLYFMAGSGGQYACIVPDKKLLVVAMSEHDTDDDLEVDFETFLEIVKEVLMMC